ncbi:MAG: thioredoxin family protein [Planctomycetaceae bacterium]
MRKTLLIAMAAAVVLTAVAVAPTLAAKFNKKVEVGQKAPAYSGVNIDDTQKSTGDYKDAKAVVVCFTCNHCPVAVAYEDRFVAFATEYKARGVEFVAINCNVRPEDRLDKMKERAEKKGFTFDYLYDESQESAKAFGATVTPHLFVLDAEQNIVYMGAFDDSQKTENVKQNYIRDAVDAVLAGKTPEVTETRQVGCGIQYKK